MLFSAQIMQCPICEKLFPRENAKFRRHVRHCDYMRSQLSEDRSTHNESDQGWSLVPCFTIEESQLSNIGELLMSLQASIKSTLPFIKVIFKGNEIKEEERKKGREREEKKRTCKLIRKCIL